MPKVEIYRGSEKLRVNFKTETQKLNFVVYHYQNNLYIKNNEVDLKLPN